MKTSTELRIELKELERQRHDLIAEAKDLEERSRIVRQLILDIDGSQYRNGKLKTKILEIQQAEIREKDELCPSPVWINPPSRWNQASSSYIVSRVTKKRIYIKDVGKRETPFSAESGVPVFSDYDLGDSRLDVTATIDTWNTHSKSQE